MRDPSEHSRSAEEWSPAAQSSHHDRRRTAPARCWLRTNAVTPVPSLRGTGIAPVAGSRAPENPCGTAALPTQRCRQTETYEAHRSATPLVRHRRHGAGSGRLPRQLDREFGDSDRGKPSSAVMVTGSR